MKRDEAVSPEVKKALEWVESIRHSEMGHSSNEKNLIVLADEIYRLRRLLKQSRVPKP